MGWIVTADRPRWNGGLFARRCRTVRTEGTGLSARPRRNNNGSVWIWVNNGLSGWGGGPSARLGNRTHVFGGFWPWVTDRPTWLGGLSVARPRIAVELAGGGSDLCFGWGLFLWVPGSAYMWFQEIYSTCIGVWKLCPINGDWLMGGFKILNPKSMEMDRE
jgi:hypothetical protein